MQFVSCHGFRALLLIGLALGLAGSAAAQGTLRGTVTDSLDTSTLPGANVYIEGAALGSATGVDGTYRIGNVPAGTYDVRVSFVGYRTKTVPVTIASGETTELDVALAPSMALGEVVVSGQLEGQAAAINQQLSANTIVNVVSEERIRELPDANAAESIGRLPGVSVNRSGGEASQIVLRGLSGRFTNITVDGVKVAPTDADSRSVDLSAISQGSLAGIELFKALTPAQDGDAVAGSVNLVTRRAPSEREIRIDALGAYSDLTGDVGQYDVDVRYGERFFDDVLGVQFTGTLENRDRSRERFNVSIAQRVDQGVTRFENGEVALNFVDETRQRTGAGVILDVGTPDGGFLKLNGSLNRTARDYVTYERNYPLDGDEILYSARDREQEIGIYNAALTAQSYPLGFDVTWGASYAYSESETPYDYDLTFTEPSTTDAEGTPRSGMGPADRGVYTGPIEDVIGLAINNAALTYLYTGVFSDEDASDGDLGAYLDARRSYSFGSVVSGTVQFGGKVRSKNRQRNRSQVLSPYYVEAFPSFVELEDGTVVPKDFAGTYFDGLQRQGSRILLTNFLADDPARDLYGRYPLFGLVDQDALRAWWDLNQSGFSDAAGQNPEYEVNREADAQFYDIDERVQAGYVMNTLNLGRRVTWIAGVRVEREDNDYLSRFTAGVLSGFPVPSGSIRDTTTTFEETIWLPNTNLIVRATDFLSVRLAAYRALARPDFNRRLANIVARNAGTFFPGNSLTVGNPQLRAAKAWNYEANVSFFGSRLGLFSVSAFYKDIEENQQVLPGLPFNSSEALDRFGFAIESPFDDEQFALTLPYNSTLPTEVYGLEIEHQTNLRFLPGPLAGFVLGYNLSFVRASTYVPRVRIEQVLVENPPFPPYEVPEFIFEETEAKLTDQPDFIANVSLGYDFRGFSARGSLFHQAATNTSFSSTGTSDNVNDGFTRVDLSLRQRLGAGASLLVNVNNLTGVDESASLVNRVVDVTRLRNGELYGTTVDFGLRVDL